MARLKLADHRLASSAGGLKQISYEQKSELTRLIFDLLVCLQCVLRVRDGLFLLGKSPRARRHFTTENPMIRGGPAVSNAWLRERLAEDRRLIAFLRDSALETQTMIAQSQATIAWSRDAISLLNRLQWPQESH